MVSIRRSDMRLEEVTMKDLKLYGLEPVCNHCGRRKPPEQLWLISLACNGAGPFDLICWHCDAKAARHGYKEPMDCNIKSRLNQWIFEKAWENLLSPY
jgi:hypothetical protein